MSQVDKQIPEWVTEWLTKVRDVAMFNMMDSERVIEMLDDMGAPEIAEWLENNPKLYVAALKTIKKEA